MSRSIRSATMLSLCVGWFVLGACSGGGGAGGGGGAASSMVGPMGGQAMSADGLLTLEIPPGALGAVENITITRLTAAELDPVVAAAGPIAAYRLEPDGLQFAQPVSVHLDVGVPLRNDPGEVATGYFDLVAQSAAGFEAITTSVTVDAGVGTTVVAGALDHFSNLLAFGVNTEDLSFSITFPPVLTGGSGTLSGSASQSANSTVTSSAITWMASTGGGLTSTIGQSTVFDAGGFNPLMSQKLSGTAMLICIAPGAKTFGVDFVIQVFDIGALLPGLTRDESPSINFSGLETNCPPPGGGAPSLLQVAGITAIEAIRSVSSPALCGFSPALLVAGLGGANVIDPVTATTVQLLSPPGSGAFFDALFFPRPPGQPDNGLFLSGNDVRMDRIDDQCNTGGFAQTSLNSNLDATYAAGDPSLGGHAAGPTGITEIVFSQGSQGWIFQDSGLPNSVIPIGLRSVQGNATGDRFLAVGAFELAFIDNSGAAPASEADSGPAPTSQTAFALGSNPRRVRWDAVSGFGAISDLDDDTITVFHWDGVTLPVLTDIVAVGAGPVGVDVMGNRIVCAGFHDATYTLIELDMNGMATSVTINSSPFAPAGNNPGHAIFLRDANNTIVMSFNGDDVIGLIPAAF